MKTLVLSSVSSVIDYDRVRLRVREGKEERKYTAGDLANLELIYLTGLSGYISLRAMRFLSHLGVSIAFRYISGKPAYDMIPQLPQRDPKLKVKQYQAFLDEKKRALIAKELVREKNRRHNLLLTEIGLDRINENYSEQVFAKQYFAAFAKYANGFGYQYEGRQGLYGVLNRQATNEVNAVLNLFYGYVEARLLREITLFGLDHQISYLHEPQTAKESLSYDLIELLRADIDRIVLEMVRGNEIKTNMFQVVNSTHYLVKDPKHFVARLDERFTRDDYKACVEWLLTKL